MRQYRSRSFARGRARAVHLHQRAPPPIERLLDHVALAWRAVHHRHDHVAAVHDVDRLLPADLLHRPRVRAVARVAQRLLGDDRRGIDQPGDDAHVAPRLGRVVEDVVELRLAVEQVLVHLLARLAQVLRDAVEQLRVAALVLDLGGQRQLPLERRRAHDPLALGQHAHQLAVGVHLDEAQHARSGTRRASSRAPRPSRRPGRAPRTASALVVGDLVDRGGAAAFRLRQDGVERERVGHLDRPPTAGGGRRPRWYAGPAGMSRYQSDPDHQMGVRP